MSGNFDPEAIRFVSTSLQETFRHASTPEDADARNCGSPRKIYKPSERLEVACRLVGAIREGRLDTSDDNVLAAVIDKVLREGEYAGTFRANPHLFGR